MSLFISIREDYLRKANRILNFSSTRLYGYGMKNSVWVSDTFGNSTIAVRIRADGYHHFEGLCELYKDE